MLVRRTLHGGASALEEPNRNMRIANRLPLVLATALILGACADPPEARTSPPAGPVREGEIAWLTDYRSAMDSAAAQDRPVIIDFYTDWCTFCQRMDREAFRDPEVVGEAKGFVMLKVNAEKDRALASRFGVRAYPHFVFLSPSGRTLRSVEGYMAPQQFAEEMRRAAQDARKKG